MAAVVVVSMLMVSGDVGGAHSPGEAIWLWACGLAATAFAHSVPMAMAYFVVFNCGILAKIVALRLAANPICPKIPGQA